MRSPGPRRSRPCGAGAHWVWQCGAAAGGAPPIAPFGMRKIAKGVRVNRSYGLGPGLVYLVCAPRRSWLHPRANPPGQHRKVSISSSEKIWVIPGCDAVLTVSGTAGVGVFHM